MYRKQDAIPNPILYNNSPVVNASRLGNAISGINDIGTSREIFDEVKYKRDHLNLSSFGLSLLIIPF